MNHAHLESGEFVAVTTPVPPAAPSDFTDFVELVRHHNAQAAMHRDEEDPLGPITLRAPKAEAQKKLVLVVDDDVDLCGRIEEALQRNGFATHIEHDGVAALDWIREDYTLSQFVDPRHPRTPSLILVNWELPMKSAFSLVQQLQTNTVTRAVEVLILSRVPSETPWVLHLDAENFDEARLLGAVRQRLGAPPSEG